MRALISQSIVVVLLLLIASGVRAQAIEGDLTATNFHAIRVSTSVISLSFITNKAAIGQVEYTEEDGDVITLTDSSTQVDHLFTIDELSPNHGYTFSITARAGNENTNTYKILLAPETVGELGTSIVPAVDEYDISGNRIASSAATSSMPFTSNDPPPWLFLFTALCIAGVSVAYRLHKRRTAAGFSL